MAASFDSAPVLSSDTYPTTGPIPGAWALGSLPPTAACAVVPMETTRQAWCASCTKSHRGRPPCETSAPPVISDVCFAHTQSVRRRISTSTQHDLPVLWLLTCRNFAL